MRNVLTITGACLSVAVLSGCLDDEARVRRQRAADAERERQDQVEESLHRLEASCQGLERALDESRDECALDRQRMAKLEAEIRDLTAKPAPKPEVHPKPEAHAKPPHKGEKAEKGDKGSEAHEVSRIQAALTKAGYKPGPVDGKMGDKTRKALEAFQKDNGLKPDGVVGPKTLEKLKPFLADAAEAPASAPAPETAPAE